MNINYLAFDLDGTLLNSKKVITSYTKKVLKESNKTIILISSRHIHEMIDYARILELKETDYLVSCDGQYIFNGLGEPLVTMCFLKTRDIRQLMQYYNVSYFKFYTNNSNYTYSYKNRRIGQIIRVIFKDIKTTYFSNDVRKTIHYLLSTYFLRIEKVIFFIEKQNNTVSEQYNQMVFDNRIELTHKSVNKFSSLKYLRDKYGVCLSSLLFFGDGINDLSVFNGIEHTVAMGNAVDSIKRIAKYQTESCDEDGIGKFIKAHCLS